MSLLVRYRSEDDDTNYKKKSLLWFLVIKRQAMMIALIWIHLHEGDLVNAAVQALGLLTSNPVPVTIAGLSAYQQQYTPEDLTDGFEAAGVISYALDTMRVRDINHITIQVRPDVYITIMKDSSEDTYTWIVGHFKETGVSKKRLLEVIKHILAFKKPVQPDNCCVM